MKLLNLFITGLMILTTVINVAAPKQAAAAESAVSPRQVFDNIQTNEGYPVSIETQGVGHELKADGTYTMTYRVAVAGEGKQATFPINVDLHRCKEGNGNHTAQGFCNGLLSIYNRTLNLNASNNYTETVTVSYQQDPAQACGSFQADMEILGQNERDIAWSIYRTGVDCPQSTPAPSPSASPSTIQCPVGKVQKVEDSTIICVAQNQNQNQNQQQNNNQNQNVNQNVVATGGGSSSSSSSNSSVNVTINNPTPTPSATPTTKVISVPQVVMQTKGDIKTLPETGLPLAALALGGLMPAGFGLKRFMKKDSQEVTANSIWTEKQLNS